jgi:hypothetical protein
MRQRIWRMLTVVIAECALAGGTAAGSGTGTGRPARGQAAGGPRAALPRSGVLALAYGPGCRP